jgi:transcriptional regulator with XRE-family HTH domain
MARLAVVGDRLNHSSAFAATMVHGLCCNLTTMVDSYAERLLKAMEAAEVDTARLADALGLSYQAVKKAEKGNTKAFNASNNAKAAKFLEVDPDWLSTGEGSMKAAPSRGATVTTIEPSSAAALAKLRKDVWAISSENREHAIRLVTMYLEATTDRPSIIASFCEVVGEAPSSKRAAM